MTRFKVNEKTIIMIPTSVIGEMYGFTKYSTNTSYSVNEFRCLIFILYKNPNKHNKTIMFTKKELLDFSYKTNSGHSIKNVSLNQVLDKFGVVQENHKCYFKYDDFIYRYKTKKSEGGTGFSYKKLSIDKWNILKEITDIKLLKIFLYSLLFPQQTINIHKLAEEKLQMSSNRKLQNKHEIKSRLNMLKDVHLIYDYSLVDDMLVFIKQPKKSYEIDMKPII